MRICYVGILEHGSTSLMREQILRQLGHQVDSIEVAYPPLTFMSRLVRHAFLRLNRPLDVVNVDARLAKLEAERFDVLWLDKVITLRTQTLAALKRRNPNLLVIGFSPDDMNNWRNNSVRFRQNLPLYDAYFTTKSYGVAELRAMGCRRVYFVGNAFDPATHRPRELSDEDRAKYGCDVNFMGIWEEDRGTQLARLAASGVRVRVYGWNWDRQLERPKNLEIIERVEMGDNYAKALCGAKISLCFLRKMNRDLQTTRSIEIPACGVFMLAERTNEHLELFQEGKEAEFFSSTAELIEKCQYYLAHAGERTAIAAAGRQRCVESGYSYVDRLQEMLSKIDDIRNGHAPATTP